MPSRKQTVLPVQVTDDEQRNAMELDWIKERRQRVAQLRTKLIYLRKSDFIDECTFLKLLQLQSIN